MVRRHAAQRLLLVVITLCAAHAAHAGLQEGLDALRRGDYPAAVAELRPLADKGDPEAQYRVALMYEYGKGYREDKTQAFTWLRKAAAQGHPGAETELAILLVMGEGVAQDDLQAFAWFRKGAEHGNVTAQYNLGLLYAKGQGTPRDLAQAIAWFGKAADQGMPLARFKLGVAYENGEGVAKDPVRAYANYAVAAARDPNPDYAAHRDDVARSLTPAQRKAGDALVAQMQGPAPAASAAAAAKAAPAPDRCKGTGRMEGQAFAATHCVAAVYPDQHSVAILFSETPVAAADADQFRLSSYLDAGSGAKARTQLTIMLCPGGGGASAAAAAVRSIDLNTNHAQSAMAGVQWVVEAPKDFRVERISGDVVPGGRIAGHIVGARGKTTFDLDFDLALPAKEAAAGLACRK
ncbi:MAG: tetratricopeptide repeat protein [Burkholderiales bacterium]